MGVAILFYLLEIFKLDYNCCIYKWASGDCLHAQLLSHVQLLVTPWTTRVHQVVLVAHPVAHQAPLSIGFSRQEYWSELACPPPGDLPDPGIELASLTSPALAGKFFTTSATWEPLADCMYAKQTDSASCWERERNRWKTSLGILGMEII